MIKRTILFKGKVRIFFEKRAYLILVNWSLDIAEIDAPESNRTGNDWLLSVNRLIKEI